MRISDWSSDVCSSELFSANLRISCCLSGGGSGRPGPGRASGGRNNQSCCPPYYNNGPRGIPDFSPIERKFPRIQALMDRKRPEGEPRSEEHTSELQSLMRISYAVFCLKKKKTKIHHTQP